MWVVGRASRGQFPNAVPPAAPGFQQFYWRRSALGYGRPRPALKRLRVKEPLAPEAVQLLDHYLRLERPPRCGAALFVSLKGRARGTRMTAAGLRSPFRQHRHTTGVAKANPHRFRHYLRYGDCRSPAALGIIRHSA